MVYPFFLERKIFIEVISMKKIFGVIAGLLLCTAVSFAQVLPANGVQNTLSASFGLPLGVANDPDREQLRFYGFIDTLQARFDISKFTVEGMLNWGALSWNEVDQKFNTFTFANTEITPYWYTNHWRQGGWWTNGNTPSYYVNFVFHPIEGFDLGMGTRLDWSVGPAPSSLGHFWEPIAHIVQGGLKDAAPGDADVVGFTYYANNYTSWYAGNTRASLGARYRYKDLLEIGVALPSGVTVNAPAFNFGLKIHPVDAFTIAVACDGIIQYTSNLYAGLTLDLNMFILDAWLGLNMRGDGNTLFPNTANAGRWGTGAAITLAFPKVGITLRPEVGFTFYNYSDYTNAWYVGGRFNWDLTKEFTLGAWSSIGFGAENRQWHNDRSANYHPSWNGGSVFDIRPDFTWKINKNHSLTIFFDFQNRKTYANTVYDVWASGFYWTFKR